MADGASARLPVRWRFRATPRSALAVPSQSLEELHVACPLSSSDVLFPAEVQQGKAFPSCFILSARVTFAISLVSRS